MDQLIDRVESIQGEADESSERCSKAEARCKESHELAESFVKEKANRMCY